MQKEEQKKHPVLSHRPNFNQKAADLITGFIGSWKFIILFFLYIVSWISIGIFSLINHWDPYPFILLNLTLSIMAAIQAPIILMAHNRSSQKERLRLEYDYEIDKKSEREIEEIKIQLNRIEKKINKK